MTGGDKRYRIVALCLLLAFGVGALDMLLPLGVAAAALYSIVVVISLLADDARVVRVIAGLSTMLIIAGGLLSPASSVPLWIVVFNRSLFIVVVWVTTMLVLYRQRAAQRIRDQQQQLEHMNRELAWQAHIDALTGVANRHFFDEQLVLECARANRANVHLALLMIDVDHFKRYNDAAGHPAGDTCLQAVAGAIQGALRRPIDFAARYGGEEFTVILPATAAAGACERAEEIGRAVRALGIAHPGLETAAVVTVSIGVVSHPPPVPPDVLVRLADEALYEAKEAGRDRVVCAG